MTGLEVGAGLALGGAGIAVLVAARTLRIKPAPTRAARAQAVVDPAPQDWPDQEADGQADELGAGSAV